MNSKSLCTFNRKTRYATGFVLSDYHIIFLFSRRHLGGLHIIFPFSRRHLGGLHRYESEEVPNILPKTYLSSHVDVLHWMVWVRDAFLNVYSYRFRKIEKREEEHFYKKCDIQVLNVLNRGYILESLPSWDWLSTLWKNEELVEPSLRSWIRKYKKGQEVLISISAVTYREMLIAGG